MISRASLFALALGLSAAPATAATLDAPAAKTRIDATLDRVYPALDALYKDLHAHPEVGFQEVRTAKVLAAQMRKLGFEVMEGVGKTGIVAIYRNGPGPTVMVRTELDGLAMQEKTGLSYASSYRQTIDGQPTYTMHSCGHDVHMAWWVGTAQALLAMKDAWSGTLMFVGQPAEEPVTGAKAMVDDGLFTRFPKPDFAFAAHVSPLAVGVVGLKEGVATSAQDAISVRFKGRGGHGSIPQATIDPIVMGAQFVNDVQTVISRKKDPSAFGVVSVGAFNSGTVANIIPDEAELKLSLRSFSPEVRKLLNDGVRRTAKAAADSAGAPEPEITYLSTVGAMMNDVPLTQRLSTALKPIFGEHMLYGTEKDPGGSGSEDFSVFADAGVPSAFIGIGGFDPKMIEDYKAQGKPVPVNHSPLFAPVPEPSIRSGTVVLTLAVLEVAGRK